MCSRKFRTLLMSLFLITASQAHAQWAVVDVGAIAQLVQQIATMRDQLQTARDQLTQTQQTLQSMRGGRGMDRLLSGVDRNYLPEDWAEWERTMQQTSNRSRRLVRDLNAILETNAVLTDEDMSRWSEAQREQFIRERRSAAALQMMSRQALASTSERFQSLEQLVGAIGTASDQKAILDLNARIAAEQTMLQNEQTKLNVLYEAMRAEEGARRQRAREMAIESIGSFRELPVLQL